MKHITLIFLTALVGCSDGFQALAVPSPWAESCVDIGAAFAEQAQACRWGCDFGHPPEHCSESVYRLCIVSTQPEQRQDIESCATYIDRMSCDAFRSSEGWPVCESLR